MGQRKTGPRAYAPKRQMVEKLIDEDSARRFGEQFRRYRTAGIPQRMNMQRESQIEGQDVFDFQESKYREYHRKNTSEVKSIFERVFGKR